MAWRFVTHACGHQERINVDGPYVVVEQRVKNAERVSCPACIGIASRQRNRLDGFCELWGSKAQCDRAEPIRRRGHHGGRSDRQGDAQRDRDEPVPAVRAGADADDVPHIVSFSYGRGRMPRPPPSPTGGE